MDQYQEAQKSAIQKYFDLCRHIMTLAVLLISVSIAFRSDILGLDPSGVWMLKLSWLLLAASILCGIVVECEELRLYNRVARAEGYTLYHGRSCQVSLPDACKFFFYSMLWCFGTSLILFLCFAIANANPSRQKQPQGVVSRCQCR